MYSFIKIETLSSIFQYQTISFAFMMAFYFKTSGGRGIVCSNQIIPNFKCFYIESHYFLYKSFFFIFYYLEIYSRESKFSNSCRRLNNLSSNFCMVITLCCLTSSISSFEFPTSIEFNVVLISIKVLERCSSVK